MVKRDLNLRTFYGSGGNDDEELIRIIDDADLYHDRMPKGRFQPAGGKRQDGPGG